MALPESTYDQFAISKLLKPIGDVYKPDIISPSIPEFKLPANSSGIDLPYSYSKNKQNDNPVGASIDKLFNSGPTERFLNSPITYNADEINAARYVTSPDYHKLGISLYGDNEERYGQNQSWGEVLSNGTVGMAKLAYNGFVDGWKGWGRMTDALIHWDWNKLHGDAESMMELDNNLKEIMNLNPIYATKEGTDTFWNRQTFGNFLQQSGFAVGAAAQMFSEQIITKAIEAGLATTGVGAGAAAGLEAVEDVKTAANIGRIARVFQKTKEFYDAAKNFKALKKLGDVWKNKSILKNFVVGLGEKIPGIDIAMDINKTYEIGKLAGLSKGQLIGDITKVGIGGLKRTLSEANFAFTEARMEAAGTFTDLYNQLQDDYYKKNGQFAKGDDLQFMQNTAMQAADKNFNFNSAVLAVSNRIMFDNIFKNSKATSKILSQFGEDVSEKGFKVLGKINNRTTTQYYTGSVFSNYKQIAADFGVGKARKVLAKSIMKPLLKFETTEGIQELLQEGSSEYFKDYYLDAYNSKFNPNIKASAEKSFGKAVESQLNMQGLKTFASGALTGMIIHGPTVLVGKGISKIKDKTTDIYKTKGYTKEQKEEYYKEKEENKNELKNYYNEFNAIAKDPSKFFSESIKNFNIQKEGSFALDEAAKLGDKFAYENIRTDMLHSMVSQAVRNNTHEGLIDTIREYGKNMSKEEFEQAFVGINYSSENKKSAQDYTEKVANAIESYAKTYNKLQDKYGSIANPNRYAKDSKQYMKELFKKKSLNDMIEILAGNEFKAADALNRSTKIYSKLSANKTLGASLSSAFNILGSEENLNKELSVLNLEIKTKKDTLNNSELSKEEKDKLQKEIELKENQKQYLEDWKNNKDELIDEIKVSKSYDSYKNYLESKNKEFGREQKIQLNEIEDTFVDFIDYVKLNKKAQNHVDAINMLSNPDYFDQVYMRMIEGQEMAYLQNLTNAAIDYIKSDKYKADEHFIVQANGKYGVFTSTGIIVKITDDLEEARKIKEELDKAIVSNEKSDDLSNEQPKENKKSIEIEVKDKEGKPHKITLIEGDEYITESNPTKRVILMSNKVVTTYDQDIIKINDLDLDNKTVSVTINNSGETVTYSLDEFSEISGKLWNLNTMNKDAALYFRNRDRVIVIKVNKDNGLLHKIDGIHANKDYSNNSDEVYAMIKYEVDPNDPLKNKILYFDYKTKNGKRFKVPFDINYYNKYGVKTNEKYLLNVAPTLEDYLKKQSKKRKLNIYNKQIEILELLIKEQEKKSGPREQRKLEINKQIDQITKDLEEAEEYVKLANKEINDIISYKRKVSQKQKREIASLKELINKYNQKLNSLKETLALLNAEKLEIENELKTLNEVSESYYLALDEIKRKETPYLRGGTSQTIYGEEQDKLDELEKERPVSYIPVDDFEKVLNSLNLEKNDIENKIKIVEDTIKRVEKLISRFIKYDDIINAIVGVDPTNNKSKKELQTALFKLKIKEQAKQEPDKEKIELINNLLSGLNTRLKGLDNQIFGKEIFEAISLVNLFDIATNEKQKLQDQLNFVSKEIEEISEGKEYIDKYIIPIKEKINYLKNIEKILLEGQAKLEALNLIEKTKTTVKAPTTEAAEQFVGYDDIMNYEEIVSLDSDKDDIILIDHDKVKFINALFKTAGRHYKNSGEAQRNNQALTPEQDRFFTFTSNSIIADKNYFLIPITEDNDKYGIIQKSYTNEQGNIVEVKNDVKLIVAKKVGLDYIPVDKYGNILSEEQQTKDNLVFNSMVNTVELMQDDVDAAIKWLRSDANKTFTITKNKIGNNGIVVKEEYTDEELKNELNTFKNFRNNIIKNIKEGISVAPLKVERKSIGKQRKEVLDVTTGRPQELELQGRLIEEDPDFSVRGELKHPDGTPIELRVSTKDSVISNTIKQGRMVMQKGDTFYQVYNRRINEDEINNIFDVILSILPMFGRRNVTTERVEKLKELYNQGVITLDRLTELTKKLSPEEEKQFDLGLRYLLHTIYWSQVKEGGKIGNKQFYIKGDSLYVGGKAYQFEIDGKIDLKNIIDSKDEIMNIIKKDDEGNVISKEPMFHAVNSGSIKKKDKQFTSVKVVDGVIVKDKEYKNYLEYLLSNKDGRTPIVYTNIVKYNKDEPQLANSYLIYSRPYEETSVPPRPKEEESKTSTTIEEEIIEESLLELPLDLNNIPKNEKIVIRKKFGPTKKIVDFYGIWDGTKFVIEKVFNVTDNKDSTSIILEKVPSTITESINNVSEYKYSNDPELKKIYTDLLSDFISISKVTEQKKKIFKQDTSVIKSNIEKLIRMGKIEYVDDTTNAKC